MLSDNMKECNLNQLLIQSLNDYSMRRTAYIKEQVSASSVLISEQFKKEMDETLEQIKSYGKSGIRRRIPNHAFLRISFAVIASVAIFLVSSFFVNPEGITASIPNIIMKSLSNVIGGVTVQLNPDAIEESSSLNPFPEVKFTYLPDGFELSQKSIDEKQMTNYYGFTGANQACIRFFILIPGEDYSLSYGSDIEFDESGTIYIGHEEVYRTVDYADGNKVLSYLWTRDGYAISVYAYKVEETVVEEMIQKMELE